MEQKRLTNRGFADLASETQYVTQVGCRPTALLEVRQMCGKKDEANFSVSHTVDSFAEIFIRSSSSKVPEAQSCSIAW